MQQDIIIIGAGPAGLTLARALHGSGLKVLLIERQPEPALSAPAFDGREIALTQASVAAMKRMGLWDRIDPAERAPLRQAKILNGPSPFALWVDPDASHGELGWLVPNHLIRKAAFEEALQSPEVSLRAGVAVKQLAHIDGGMQVTLDTGETLSARLVVAADSRFSETRRAVGIAADMHDFGKTMMVCRMQLERDHEQVAWEWFDHDQTLALLPLNGRVASAVLTLPSQDIEALKALDESTFNAEITRRFHGRLGAMQRVAPLVAYPLVAVYARRFVAPNFVCVGDAAVGMHPVTAHGFNFGLAGAVNLARRLAEAQAAGRDIADASLLSAWEAEHRAFTRPLYLATNAIAQLYTDERLPARVLRKAAIQVGQSLPPIRQALSAAVTGERLEPAAWSSVAARALALVRNRPALPPRAGPALAALLPSLPRFSSPFSRPRRVR